MRQENIRAGVTYVNTDRSERRHVGLVINDGRTKVRYRSDAGYDGYTTLPAFARWATAEASECD